MVTMHSPAAANTITTVYSYIHTQMKYIPCHICKLYTKASIQVVVVSRPSDVLALVTTSFYSITVQYNGTFYLWEGRVALYCAIFLKLSLMSMAERQLFHLRYMTTMNEKPRNTGMEQIASWKCPRLSVDGLLVAMNNDTIVCNISLTLTINLFGVWLVNFKAM